RNLFLDPDEIWPMTLAFIPRFLVLGLVTGVSFIAILFVLRYIGIPLTFILGAVAHPVRRSWGILVGACLVTDVALTFVTPVLALWCKGAVVAFSVRLHPTVSDSGAAYADEPARPPRRRA